MIQFIADLGSNHNQNIERTLRLIAKAKEIGCDAVKFQLFNEGLYAPQYKRERESIKKQIFPLEFLQEVTQLCSYEKLKLGFSVFYLEAVDILKDRIDFFKIGSYELLWINLIKKTILTGKPVIISTGMATENELISVFNSSLNLQPDNPITFLHCNSSYPAKISDCNLSRIKSLYHSADYHCLSNRIPPLYNIGWSDHTASPAVIYQAIAQGAQVIEFHMDLDDEKGSEYKYGHCWLPYDIQCVIKNVRLGELALSKDIDQNEIEMLRQKRLDPRNGHRPIMEFRNELD